jgi:hypothetical protein
MGSIPWLGDSQLEQDQLRHRWHGVDGRNVMDERQPREPGPELLSLVFSDLLKWIASTAEEDQSSSSSSTMSRREISPLTDYTAACRQHYCRFNHSCKWMDFDYCVNYVSGPRCRTSLIDVQAGNVEDRRGKRTSRASLSKVG